MAADAGAGHWQDWAKSVHAIACSSGDKPNHKLQTIDLKRKT
jgi:hypothetical protein